MACPYFEPREPIDERDWPRASRLPLGLPWRGACRAAGVIPDDCIVREFCNLGYPRHGCPHAPGDDGPDAVSFCLAAEKDGILVVRWARERDHQPYDAGTLDFSAAGECLSATAPLLTAQAAAYVTAFLRHKSEYLRVMHG